MFNELIGHQAQKDYLARVAETGHLAQAYCFSGPSGVGKMTMAREFVGIGPMPGLAPTINPNITAINGGSIEEIRDLRERLSLSAFGGERKIALIDGAEQMTVAAQNALLKTLEEPLGQTTIILVTANADALLPTILSRVIHLRFTLVERELICKMLRSRDVGADPGIGPIGNGESDLAHELAGFAAGRPGVALAFQNPEVLAEYRSARAQAELFIAASLANKISQIDEIVKASREDKSRVQEFLDHIIAVLHEQLLAGSNPTSNGLSAALEARTSLNHNGNRSLLLEHVALHV